jgi:hypothetical protein
MLRFELLDPFGTVIGCGELEVPDVPGIDQHTPSVADEIRSRFVGQRISLDRPGPPYSLRVVECEAASSSPG